MSVLRPFRRANRNLGTFGGSPSELDDVNAEGPPILPVSPSLVTDVVAGIEYWDRERVAAVQGDLEQDVNSDFESVTDTENSAWDSLAENNESGGDSESNE